jgi:hypothetical protein
MNDSRLLVEYDIGPRTIAEVTTPDELRDRFPNATELYKKITELLAAGPAVDR